jgi:hypothetical protein
LIFRDRVRRDKAEQWIKEGEHAVKMTRLCCHRFSCNEVWQWFNILAYNLCRRLALPGGIEGSSPTSLQQGLVKAKS